MFHYISHWVWVTDLGPVGRWSATMFKSPLRKLVRFFQKSRDGWKAKCQKAKTLNKRLATQARAVQKSRDAWRRKAESAERELRDLRQVGGIAKKHRRRLRRLISRRRRGRRPIRTSSGTSMAEERIRHFLRLVLDAACSFRGARCGHGFVERLRAAVRAASGGEYGTNVAASGRAVRTAASQGGGRRLGLDPRSHRAVGHREMFADRRLSLCRRGTRQAGVRWNTAT